MRYNRQIMLPEIGNEGQAKLKAAKVLIVGVGGLGSPIALYLTGAGVGTIGLVDNDEVSISNLQRQVIYTEEELGDFKAVCAAMHLTALNSEITVNSCPGRLNKDNASELISDYDIVVDGCDNFATRYLINDICIEQGKPKTYRDLYPDEEEMLRMPPPPKGVLGVTPAITGSVEATEVLKIICGFGEVLAGKLWTIDLRTWQSNIFSL